MIFKFLNMMLLVKFRLNFFLFIFPRKHKFSFPSLNGIFEIQSGCHLSQFAFFLLCFVEMTKCKLGINFNGYSDFVIFSCCENNKSEFPYRNHTKNQRNIFTNIHQVLVFVLKFKCNRNKMAEQKKV